jgi:hypothetical protein
MYSQPSNKEESRSGRPRATNEKRDKMILKIATTGGDISFRAIAEEMKVKGVVVNPRTVRHRLAEAHAEYTPPLLKPLLTERHQEVRLAWAMEYAEFNWDNVIFTDKTTGVLNRPPIIQMATSWSKNNPPHSETSIEASHLGLLL